MDITHQLKFKFNFILHSSNYRSVGRIGDLGQATYHWLGTHYQAVIYSAVVQSVILLVVVSEVKVSGCRVLRYVTMEKSALIPTLGV